MSALTCGCDPAIDWKCSAHIDLSNHMSSQYQPIGEWPTTSTARPIKDSGQRQEFDSGMVRDITDGKVDYLLTRDGPMFERWAAHLTNGAKKYDKRNWMKAESAEELERFRMSAARHFEQWLRGDTDEDHASACYFNINGAEYVKERLR